MARFTVEFNTLYKLLSRHSKIRAYINLTVLKERYEKRLSNYHRLLSLDIRSNLEHNGIRYCGTKFYNTNNPIANCDIIDTNHILRCDSPNNKTYILHDGSNFIEVNKKSACKLLGLESINVITQIENFILDLEENRYNPKEDNTDYYDSYQIIAYAKRVIDRHGYFKVLEDDHYNGKSTRNLVESLLDADVSFYEEEYKDIVTWILKYDGDNNFIQYVKTLVENRYIQKPYISKIISIYVLYKNDIKINKYQYYSNIGRHVEVDVTYSKYRGSYTEEDKTIYVYEFVNNNKYSFIVKSYEPLDFYDFVTHISGTVKDFGVYKDEKQTVLCDVNFKTFL